MADIKEFAFGGSQSDEPLYIKKGPSELMTLSATPALSSPPQRFALRLAEIRAAERKQRARLLMDVPRDPRAHHHHNASELIRLQTEADLQQFWLEQKAATLAMESKLASIYARSSPTAVEPLLPLNVATAGRDSRLSAWPHPMNHGYPAAIVAPSINRFSLVPTGFLEQNQFLIHNANVRRLEMENLVERIKVASSLQQSQKFVGNNMMAALEQELVPLQRSHHTHAWGPESRSSFPIHQKINSNSRNHHRGIVPAAAKQGRPSQKAKLLLLAIPDDHGKLNEQQIFLRHQIEVFRATEQDILSHTRSRNKPIVKGQVGIRCRHCSHISLGGRRRGSTYFPSSLMGIYQAAHNLSVEHLQSGLCPSFPVDMMRHLSILSEKKSGVSLTGKLYWADAAARLGLVDTEDGIRHADDVLD